VIAFSAIQSTAAAALAADSYFTAGVDVPIVTDLGLQDETIEGHLNSTGCVVVVSPVVRAVRTDQGGKLAAIKAEFIVEVLLNPEVNAGAGGANRVAQQAVEAVARVIIAIAPAPGDRRFEIADEFAQLVTDDAGLIAYHMMFTKLTTLP